MRKSRAHALSAGRCKSSQACFQLCRFYAGASTMEEGKLVLSVTVLYCHDYFFFSRRSFFRLSDLKFSASYNGYERDMSSISFIVDDRPCFHSVIQTGETCRLFFKSYRYRCHRFWLRVSKWDVWEMGLALKCVNKSKVHLPKNKYSDSLWLYGR